MANKVVAKTLILGTQLGGRELLIAKRCKATAAPALEMPLLRRTPSAVTSPTNNTPAAAVVEDSEWTQARTFDEMPGRVRSKIATIWSMIRAIGSGAEIDIYRSQLKSHDRYGPIWRTKFPAGYLQRVTTTNPEDTEKVFRNEGKLPERPGFETLKHYRKKRKEQFTSSASLVAQGDDWWKIRSKAQQPFLKTKNVEHYVPVLGDIGDEFIERIRLIRQENNEMKPDFINEMYRWALESVAAISLNARLGCLDPNLAPDSDAQKLITAANVSFQTANKMEFTFPVWKYYMTKPMRKFFKAQDLFTDITVKYINQTLEEVKKRPINSEVDPSILEIILMRGVSPQDAMVMGVDMFLAGIDTTSHTTSFMLYFLAKNPDKQEKLRQEIISVVGPKGSKLTPEALRQLSYIRACTKESLRLVPAVLGTARITVKDLVLSGYQVPKGTLVSTAHQLIGHSDEFFPSAKAFIPERWIKGDPQESLHHPYAVLPFGFGMRMCVGRRLAELEMWQLTIKILQNFKVEWNHDDLGFVTRLVNVPDKPLRFTFKDL